MFSEKARVFYFCSNTAAVVLKTMNRTIQINCIIIFVREKKPQRVVNNYIIMHYLSFLFWYNKIVNIVMFCFLCVCSADLPFDKLYSASKSMSEVYKIANQKREQIFVCVRLKMHVLSAYVENSERSHENISWQRIRMPG